MTPVTRSALGVASAALVVALLPSVAPAEQPPDQVSGLVGRVLGTQQQQDPPRRDRSSYGHTKAPNGKLRKGCHNYPYRYRLTLPSNDWTLETFLRDRTGDGIASGAFASQSDPAAKRSHFRFCHYEARAGRFTIRALVHWYDDMGNDHHVWLEPSHFRLRKPR